MTHISSIRVLAQGLLTAVAGGRGRGTRTTEGHISKSFKIAGCRALVSPKLTRMLSS